MTHMIPAAPDLGALQVTGGEMRHYKPVADRGWCLDAALLRAERPELATPRPFDKPPIPIGFIVGYVSFSAVVYEGEAFPTPWFGLPVFAWCGAKFVSVSNATHLIAFGGENKTPLLLRGASPSTTHRKFFKATPQLEFSRKSTLLIDTRHILILTGAAAPQCQVVKLIPTKIVDQMCAGSYTFCWEPPIVSKNSFAAESSANI